MNSDRPEDLLAEELREITAELKAHNRIIRRNRLATWLTALALTLVVVLGVVFYYDDQHDDHVACELDNENSVRDSEVLIGAVSSRPNLSEQTRQAIEEYRRDVQENLRVC